MPAPIAIRLHPNDNVVVARMDILANTKVEGDVAAATRVPPGHKILTRAVKKGEPLRKYNQIIGFATDDLAPGTHIHTHNCVMGDFERDYAFCTDAHPTDYAQNPATFMGYRRADGRSATRNYVGIVTTVNCSASTSRMIAKQLEPLLAQYPNIDGVVPLTHGGGCGMAASGLEMDVLRRTIGGYTRHPNMAAVVVLGLGCETNQISGLMDAEGLKEGPKLIPMTIQDEGGVSKTVMRAVGFLKEMLPEANDVTRVSIPASELILALQCGGSDGYSGISANPALGAAVDLLVKNGGSAVLSETPEIYGAEHLLTRRAASREVGEKIVSRIKWWEDHCARTGGEMNNNPSPGTRRAASRPSWRNRWARWPRAARPTWSTSMNMPSRSRPRASSTWIRLATTRCRPPDRSRAAPMSSASRPAAAACSGASPRRRSSSRRIARSTGV